MNRTENKQERCLFVSSSFSFFFCLFRSKSFLTFYFLEVRNPTTIQNVISIVLHFICLMLYEQELSVAIQACLQAARLCECVRSNIPQAIEKADQTPVTVSKIAIDHF
jgi:hypothetical protein